MPVDIREALGLEVKKEKSHSCTCNLLGLGFSDHPKEFIPKAYYRSRGIYRPRIEEDGLFERKGF